MILHLVLRKEWEASRLDQPFVPQAFARDGFVHCTRGLDTLLVVANTFYKGQPGEFLALEIDETRLKAPVKWEAPSAPQTPTRPVEAPQTPEQSPSLSSAGAGALPPEVLAEYGTGSQTSGSQTSGSQTSGSQTSGSQTSGSQTSGSQDAGTALAPTEAPASPVPPVEPPAPPAQTFPHVYGPLNRDAITGIRIAVRDKDGTFTGFTQAFKPDDRTQAMRAADDLLKATDNFSEALAQYKDRLKSQMDDLDEQINKGLP